MSDPWKRREVIGDATLYLGDCLEILPTLGPVDAVVTDPPYGIAAELGMGGGSNGTGGMWSGVAIVGDDDVWVRDMALNITAGTPFAVFASPRRPAPPGARAVVVWDKGLHTGAGDLSLPWKPNVELVYVGGRGWTHSRRIGAVVRIPAVAGCVAARNDGHRFHPFEKPVAIMAHFVERAPRGAVLDPFAGSGTTGVACAQLGRRFVGIEIEPRYFELACERIAAAQAQGRLFPDEAAPAPEQASIAWEAAR